MAEYIEREDLFKTVEDYASTHPVMNDNELFALFCSVPAADVQKVRSGKWMYDDDMNTGIYAICSCCKESIYQAFEFHYCPNCGARMEREE